MTARTAKKTRRALAFVLAFTTLALAGCVGQGEVQTRFYLLNPLPASTLALAGARERSLAIDIAALRLPQYLQRPQIVTRTSDNQVQLAEYEQWGGNLSKDLMQVLARNLSRLLATPEIAVFSRRPARTAHVRIEIDVLQFERGPAGRVLLAVQWRLRHGGNGDPVTTRITELGSPSLPAESDMEATVSAMSTLWGEFSRIVAEAVMKAKDSGQNKLAIWDAEARVWQGATRANSAPLNQRATQPVPLCRGTTRWIGVPDRQVALSRALGAEA